MLKLELLEKECSLLFKWDHISRLLDLREELVFWDFGLGYQRFADFGDHLHHLELEVIYSVVEQSTDDADSDGGNIVKV